MKDLKASDTSWTAWRVHILTELDRFHKADEKINQNIDKLVDVVAELKSDVKSLKKTASFWGAVMGFVCGLIPAFGAVILEKFLK